MNKFAEPEKNKFIKKDCKDIIINFNLRNKEKKYSNKCDTTFNWIKANYIFCRTMFINYRT